MTIHDLATTSHGGAYILAVFALYAMSEWLVDGAIALLVAVL